MNFFRAAALSLFLSLLADAQQDRGAKRSDAPPDVAYDTLPKYDAWQNLVFVCRARASQAPNPTVYTRADTLVSITVSAGVGTVTVNSTVPAKAASAGHGYQPGYYAIVAGDPAIAGTYLTTAIPSLTTFTLAMPGKPDGTYNSAALMITTYSPPTNGKVWSIEHHRYDFASSTGLRLRSGWANDGTNVAAPSPAELFSCDDAARYFAW